MATELDQLVAPGTNSTSTADREVIDRAARLLHSLQHAARAARLEAQVIELQAALSKARQGDLGTLTIWLDGFEQSQGTYPARDASLPVAIAEATADTKQSDSAYDTATVQPTNPSSSEDADARERLAEPGWAVYLSHARRRLDVIKSQRGDALPWLVAKVVTPCPVVSDQPSVTDLAHDEISSSLLDDAGIAGIAVVDEEFHAEPSIESNDQLSEEGLACLGPLTSAEAVAKSEPVALRKRLFSSYGLSVLGHAIVLIALGTMTYRESSEGNSLGSQVLAAEARSETEMSSQVEMVEPTDTAFSEPMSDVQPTTSLAAELSQVVTSASAVEVDVTVNNAGATIASALAAPSGSSSSGARGSGVPSMSGTFFGVGTGGNYFCYVVDRSGSMRGGAWDSAKAELIRSLKSLKPTQKFYIVFFSDEFEALPEPGSDQPAPTGLYATPENVDHARRWIQSVELNRGGPPNQALAWAIEREPDAIYLLTDGVTKVDVCGFLRKTNRIEDIVSGPQVRVPIHAIAYFSLDGQQLMRQLAQENQGQFIYVPKPKANRK